MGQPIRLPDIPLWEERWNQQALLQRKGDPNSGGSRAFDRGFHLKAYSDEEKWFKSFTDCYNPGLKLAQILERRYPAFVGVDLAGKTRPGNCIFVTGLEPGTHLQYPLEVMRGAWSSPETAGHIADVATRHNVRYILVENNAYQVALVDWLRNDSRTKGTDLWKKVDEFHTGKQKADEVFGLPSLEIEFKNRVWAIASSEFDRHEATCQCNWCVWVREMKEYPMGGSSDTVMACWFSREAIARWGNVEGMTIRATGFNTR